MHRESLLERGLPCNVEAERYVLAMAIEYPSDCLGSLSALLTDEDFSVEANRRIFKAAMAIYEAGHAVNRVALADHLNAGGQLESVGGVSGLMAISEDVPRIVNVEGYARIVREKAVQRRAIMRLWQTIERISIDGEAGLAQAEQTLAQIADDSQPRDRQFRRPEEVMLASGSIEAFFQQPPGLSTPLPSLNRKISGLRPAQLILVAARPGVGKTALAMQIAEHAARKGAGVAFFSLEMSAEELLHRTICARASVNQHCVRQGLMDANDSRLLAAAAGKIAPLPIHIDDSARCTVASIGAAVRRLRARSEIGLVIVDYLQLIQTTGRPENRVNEIAQISRGLKLVAKEQQLPVIALCQLNRGSEHEKRRPTLTDLRDGGTLEQDADVVLAIHASGKDPQPNGYDCELLVLKQRNGPRGSIPLFFDTELTSFEEAGQ